MRKILNTRIAKYLSLIILVLVLMVLTTKVTNNYLIKEANSFEVVNFNNINLSSCESVILYDRINNKTIYEKNKDKILLPASLTKIMTCIIALENIDLDKYYLVDEEIINITGSRLYLEANDIIYGYDILYGLMLRSGNDCANLLASLYSLNEIDFIDKMNSLAEKLQMNNTVFNNVTGLDENTKNYTSAYDLAILMDYCLDNQKFSEITKTKEITINLLNNRTLYLKNKHKLIVNNNLVTGGKTGVFTFFCEI